MKKRDGKAEGSSGGGGGGGGGGSEYKKKRRLGGKGLSLEAFVGANKVKPVVTASQIRKQREAYQNSKKVNKYRKTLKHLAEEGHEFRPRVPLSVNAEIPGEGLSDPSAHSNKETPTPSAASEKEEPSSEKGGKKPKTKKKAKPPSHLERLREEYEKKRQEEEEIRREKRALFEEQQVAREKSKKERKEVQKKFRKTTGKGQPVMKHRMEHLLESIQRDMKS